MTPAAQQLAAAMASQPKRSKYGNKPVEIDGIRFASAREGRRYSVLKLREMRGEIFGLTLQPRFPLRVNDKLITTYVGDFLYRTEKDGGQRVVEDAKGFRTPEYKIKARLFAVLYGYEITEV